MLATRGRPFIFLISVRVVGFVLFCLWQHAGTRVVRELPQELPGHSVSFFFEAIQFSTAVQTVPLLDSSGRVETLAFAIIRFHPGKAVLSRGVTAVPCVDAPGSPLPHPNGGDDTGLLVAG
eukprot:TRINITY_DN1250_c0_g1_i1.p1 TRINITY_DN1250_c0_g1~~TRINITY_DN1250_c0_g1_i1.p1  ORF type:complete len:121 (+),score=2.61 TRINITY_DN1250_c0_g1_i1:162-524(+)